MLLDSLGQLDSAHAYTATAISTNVIDLLPNTAPTGGQTNLIRDIGAGEELHLSILITTAVTTNVSTVFTLESAADTSLASAATIHWTGPTVLLASLVAGYWYAQGIIIPPGAYQRYLGIRMTPSTNWGAGAASAWIHKGRWDTRAYAAGSVNSVS
jgi:hypothetical protein